MIREDNVIVRGNNQRIVVVPEHLAEEGHKLGLRTSIQEVLSHMLVIQPLKKVGHSEPN